ncbi:hypothetical protein LX32DRAFT_205488 [Colletotrichum zoysiae]|uniref:C2H2-type domain-containing protein n=1 Tax=Colletotrichum zoysiae TaxID=1216348 RepID=A0AAD9H6B6_9PEZI|nr:hypothetical protein LX32DRAFT_205488 [Colletotrichum zoysiae]
MALVVEAQGIADTTIGGATAVAIPELLRSESSFAVTNTTEPFNSPNIKTHSHTISGAKYHCRWKDCSFDSYGSEELAEHMLSHRRCPKDDCTSSFPEEKEKRRHVWKTHRKWAVSVGYPSIAGVCGTCGEVFARQDYVLRHNRRKHHG